MAVNTNLCSSVSSTGQNFDRSLHCRRLLLGYLIHGKMAQPLLLNCQEERMNAQTLKHQEDVVAEFHCIVCGAYMMSGELCQRCERRGLSPEQYAEFFWEEA